MRIWQRIKVNDTVVYQNKVYIVLKIYEEYEDWYTDLKSIEDDIIIKADLKACQKKEN